MHTTPTAEPVDVPTVCAWCPAIVTIGAPGTRPIASNPPGTLCPSCAETSRDLDAEARDFGHDTDRDAYRWD